MGTLGNRDCQRESRSALKDFTDDALTISAGSLFQNGTARRKCNRNAKMSQIVLCNFERRLGQTQLVNNKRLRKVCMFTCLLC